MAGLSLLAVLVTSISTFAWFQLTLDTEPVSGPTIGTGSPDVNVERIKGYKYEYDEPSKGAIDYASGDVTSVTTYDDLGDVDVSDDMEAIEFDIPAGGTGFYLMGDSAWVDAFNYAHSTSYNGDDYAYKFAVSEQLIEKSVYSGESYSSTMFYKKDVYIKTAGTQLRIKKHYFSTGNTTNEFVTFTIDSSYSRGLISEASPTNISTITIVSSGYYNFWYDFGLARLGIEESFSPSTKNLPSQRASSPVYPHRASGGPTRLNASGTASNTTYTKIIVDESHYDWDYNTLFLDNFSFSDGYTVNDLEYFIYKTYGTRVDNMSGSSTTRSWKRYNNGFNLCAGGTGNTHEYYLPTWVQTCTIAIETSKADYSEEGRPSTSILMNYLNNLHAKAGKSRRWDNNGAFRHSNFGSQTTGVAKTVRFTEYYYDNFNHGVSSYGDANNTYNNWKSVVFETSVSNNSGNYTWTTETVTLLYVDSNGNNMATQPSAPGNYINCNFYIVPSDPTAPSGYTFQGWTLTATRYSTQSHSMGNTTTSNVSAGDKIQVQAGITVKAVFKQQWTLTLGAKFYLPGGTTRLDLSITSVKNSSGSALSNATKYYDGSQTLAQLTNSTLVDTSYYFDTNNCIWYVFDRDDATKWYTDAGDEYTQTPSSNLTLFAKFVAKPMATIYCDVKNVINSAWASVKFHAWGTWGNGSGMSTTQDAKCIINSKFYRLTIPSNCTGFILQNGNSSGGDNQTSDITTITDGGYLRAVNKKGSGKNADWFYDGDITRSTGTLWISRAADNYASNKFQSEPMSNGETLAYNTTNKVVVENGIIFYEGDLFVVYYDVYSGGNHYYWHDTPDGTYSYAERVDTTQTAIEGFTGFNSGNQKVVVRIKQTGRYTIYFKYTNGAHTIAIAKVPLDGNGYYIMTSPTNQCVSFDNAHKMKTISGNSTNRAFLKNLYIASDCYVYMRSYNDNVDLGPGDSNNTRYTGQIGSGGTNTRTVFIDITSPGYYNVYAFYNSNTHTEDNIRFSIVATDERDTFFTLNSISAHGTNVKSQNTSLVMEVSFSVDCVDASSISILVNNSYANIGSFAICTDKRIKKPYEVLRSAIYEGGYDYNDDGDYSDIYDIPSSSLSTENHTFSNLQTTTANNGEKIYYAYILFDYTTINIEVAPSGSFSCYIQSEQVVSQAI